MFNIYSVSFSSSTQVRDAADMHSEFSMIVLSERDETLSCFKSNSSDKFYHKNVVHEVAHIFDRLNKAGVNAAKLLRPDDDDDIDLGSAASSSLYREYVRELANRGIVGYLIMPIILL